jgi:MOSC domain-containing protein YiiM
VGGTAGGRHGCGHDEPSRGGAGRLERMSPQVTAVCVVHTLRPEPTNPGGRTAIDKRAVPGPVEVGPLGVAGDRQLDTRHHGGLEQAVYAYADEDAAWWVAELGREVPPGLFGENLRTSGVDITDAEIGERWRIGGPGGLLVQVTAPRIPCATFQRRMSEQHWVKRFTDHGAPGAYVAVVEPGAVSAGADLVVESRPGHGVTIGDAFLRPEPDVMRRLLAAEGAGALELTPKMREHASKAAARGGVSR